MLSKPNKFLRTFCATTLAMTIAILGDGCAKKQDTAKASSQPKSASYRGYGFWFQDLAKRFESAVNPAGQPPRYTLRRLPDFDALATEMYQELAMTLSSACPMTELSFGEPYSEMLQPMDVAVANTLWVKEFAQNGWLSPFDEAAIGPILKEAGIEPIRAVGPNDDPKSPRIYGVPITRAADCLFYRKSYFNSQEEARQAWASLFDSTIQSPKTKLPLPVSIATDGQEFYRFFLPLVWSLQSNWPQEANGTFEADSAAARQVLKGLQRSTQIETWPTAATRMEFLVDLKEHIRSFTMPPQSSGPASIKLKTISPSAWLLSTWAQRILITPWGPPGPLNDIGVLPLTASPQSDAKGYTMIGGKCLICSLQVDPRSPDPRALAAREVVEKLTKYLLSEVGQRTLFFDQFELPARRGLLQSLKQEDVAAVFGARREWSPYDDYLAQVRAGKRRIDDLSQEQGRATLTLTREIETMLDERLIIQPGTLSINENSLIDGFLHSQLAQQQVAQRAEQRAPAETGTLDQSGTPDRRPLERLQVLLEAQKRFMAARRPVLQKAQAP